MATQRRPISAIAGASPRRDATVDRIQQYILSEGLHPGDLLPTESDLCEQLGVSRSSVREAVRALSTLDIVEVRHGRGTFVGQMSLAPMVKALVFRAALSPGEQLRALREIVEVREGLDTAMAQALVARVAGTSNPDLYALVDAMESASAEQRSFAEEDRAFHTGLLTYLDNALVGQMVAAFWDIHFAVLPKLGIGMPTDLAVTARAHGDMLRAAEAGDVPGYIAAVEAHYAPLLRILDETSADESE